MHLCTRAVRANMLAHENQSGYVSVVMKCFARRVQFSTSGPPPSVKRCNRFNSSHVISYRLQLRLISSSKSDYPTVLLTCSYAVCRARQLENRILMMTIFVPRLSPPFVRREIERFLWFFFFSFFFFLTSCASNWFADHNE